MLDVGNIYISNIRFALYRGVAQPRDNTRGPDILDVKIVGIG